MANKRQRKKQEKKLLQNKVTAQADTLKIRHSEVKKKSYNTLQTLSHKADKIQKNRENRERLHTKKKSFLQSLGIDTSKLTKKDINRIKVKDIENKRVNETTYPGLFDTYDFDFDKVYTFPDGKNLFFAFRDFSGERSFEDILADYHGMPISTLLNRLNSIVERPASYIKGVSGTSSGASGEYKFQYASKNVIQLFNRENYNQNRRKPKRKRHTGAHKGFQVLKSGRSISIDKATPRRLLEVANAIMYNITEVDRQSFYRNFYAAMKSAIPEFAELLPKP